jgi:hypothetical protein
MYLAYRICSCVQSTEGKAGSESPADPQAPPTLGDIVPSQGPLAPHHLEGASSVGGSDLAILSRTRMGFSS